MENESDKVWKVMQDKFGWNNYPIDIERDYFEDVIKATKIVVKNAETELIEDYKCSVCGHSDFEPKQ